MRINEFSILEYGPLPKVKKVKPDNFTVFYGKNEAGKSLIVESLLKMFYCSRTERNAFCSMDRVSRDPTGYILLTHNGQEEKYPKKGSLFDNHNISSETCKNIFVIQDSDLRINEQGEFYGKITDRLLGLEINRIKEIREKLQKIGQYTSTRLIKNTQGNSKLRDRYEKATDLIVKIEDYISDSKSNGKYEADLKLVRSEKLRIKLNSEISNLEKAEKREKYEKAIDTLKQIEKLKEKEKEFENFNDETRGNWHESKTILKEKQDLLGKKENSVENKKGELKDLKEKKKDLANKESKLNRKQQKIEGKLTDLIFAYDKSTKEGAIVRDSSALKKLGYISGFGTVIALILAFFFPLVWVTAILGFLVTGFTVYQLSKTSNDRDSPEYRLNELLVTAEPFIEAKTASQVKQFMENIDLEHKQATNNLTDIKSKVGSCEKTLEEEKENLNSLKEEISNLKGDILNFKKISGVDKLSDYTEKLKEKGKMNNKISSMQENLKTLLGNSDTDQELENLEEYKNSCEHIKFDKSYLEQKKKKLIKIRDEIKKNRNLVGEIRQEIHDLSQEANSCFENNHIECVFIEDLNSLSGELKNFVENVKTRLEAAQTAEEALKKVQSDQKTEIKDLFKDSEKVFSKITQGNYTGIEYDESRERVFVINSSGQKIDASKLSQGTFDQLYLSIRINFSEKLLNEEKGFFLFDDPFISSDIDRLKEQLSILRELADEGWQIMYFTAKEEVKDCLEGDCNIVNVPIAEE